MRGKDRKKEMCSQGASTGYSIEMQNLCSLYNCKIQRREKREEERKGKESKLGGKRVYLFILPSAIHPPMSSDALGNRWAQTG